MSQHDFDVANAPGASIRSDINDALKALASLSSGPTEPASPVAYQVWLDTTTGILKQRNGANNAWGNFVDSLQQGIVIGGSTTGTDNYALTLTPTLKAYSNGMLLEVTITNANTSAANLNIDTLGNKAIVDAAGSALEGADVPANSRVLMMYVAADNAWRIIANYTRILKAKDKIAFMGVLSPAQITSNQNNYNPTDLATSSTLRIYSDAARQLTGLAGGEKGRVMIVSNVGTFTITLRNQNASSTAGNRFAFFGDLQLRPDTSVVLQYDATSSRWRILSAPATAEIFAQCRLTPTSGLPVTTSDVTAAGTLYLTPYKGNRLSLYSNSIWETLAFTEISISLSGLTTGKPYDVFAYNNGGAVACETLVWTNDTTRATALAYQDGVLVKSGDATRRYIGTFYTTATGQTEDSTAKRYVWNYYNRVKRQMLVFYNAASWTYSLAAPRQFNNNVANQLNFLVGVAEDTVSAILNGNVANNTATQRICFAGIALDYNNSLPAIYEGIPTAGTWQTPFTVSVNALPAAGVHYLAAIEVGAGADTQTWIGTAKAMTGEVFG